MHIETLGNDTTSCLTALRIYNSNPDFLSHHLGQEQISLDFIDEERREAALHGFGLRLISAGGRPSAFSTICNDPPVMYICPFLFWMPPHSDRDSEGEHSTRLRPWFEAVALHAFASTWSMTTNPI